MIRLIPDCVQYERLWKLVSRQQILTISQLWIFNTFTVFDNFQHSTTFKIQLWRFNNFQHLTLITFNIEQLQYLTTNNFQHSTTFNNFQLSNIQQLSTFNFDNLVSNMQFYFSVLELATYRNLEVENFRLLTLKTYTFVVWGFNFEIWTLKFEDSSFEDFHFRTLKFQVWSFSLSQFQVWRVNTFWRFSLSHFEVLGLKFQVWGFRYLTFKVIFGSFRFLSLSRRRPSLRIAGQATDISPLAVAFIPADGAEQRR